MSDKVKYPQDELTEKMHSEFSVDEETEIKHKAGVIWRDYPNSSEEFQRQYCKDMGITWEQCLRWKDYWLSLK